MSVNQGRLGFKVEMDQRPAGLTSYAGAPLFVETARALGLPALIERFLGQKWGHRRGYSAVDLTLIILVGIVAGAKNVDDIAAMGQDKGLQVLLELKMPYWTFQTIANRTMPRGQELFAVDGQREAPREIRFQKATRIRSGARQDAILLHRLSRCLAAGTVEALSGEPHLGEVRVRTALHAVITRVYWLKAGGLRLKIDPIATVQDVTPTPEAPPPEFGPLLEELGRACTSLLELCAGEPTRHAPGLATVLEELFLAGQRMRSVRSDRSASVESLARRFQERLEALRTPELSPLAGIALVAWRAGFDDDRSGFDGAIRDTRLLLERHPSSAAVCRQVLEKLEAIRS